MAQEGGGRVANLPTPHGDTVLTPIPQYRMSHPPPIHPGRQRYGGGGSLRGALTLSLDPLSLWLFCCT